MPVIIAPYTRKARICELLAGKQFAPIDFDFIKHTSPEEINNWLSKPKFKRQLFLNSKRIDHTNKYNIILNALTGSSVANPIASTSTKVIQRSLKVYTKEYGLDFIKKAVQIAVASSPQVASKILGVNIEIVENWLRAREGQIAEYRKEVLDKLASKSLDIMDLYLDTLQDPAKIAKAKLSDVAMAYSIVSDKAKDIAKKGWDDSGLPIQQQGGNTNYGEVKNIINILVNDAHAKENIIKSTLERMNLLNTEPIVTADQIKQKKLLQAGEGSLDPV